LVVVNVIVGVDGPGGERYAFGKGLGEFVGHIIFLAVKS